MIFYFIGGAFLTTISGAATIFGTINSFTEYQNLSNVYNFQNINSYSGVKGISFDDFYITTIFQMIRKQNLKHIQVWIYLKLWVIKLN